MSARAIFQSRERPACESRAPSQTACGRKNGADLFDAGKGMSEGRRHFALQPHSESQRHDIEQAARIHPQDLERHERFIQAAFAAGITKKVAELAPIGNIRG